MTRVEVIGAIGELAARMERSADDREALLDLAAGMRIRLDHLEAHAVAGRPDLKPPTQGAV